MPERGLEATRCQNGRPRRAKQKAKRAPPPTKTIPNLGYIHPSKVISLIQAGWFKASAGGTLYIPEHCFYQLFINQPNFYDNFKEAVYRLSYLAKCYSKRRVSQSVKNYSSSRLEYNEGS